MHASNQPQGENVFQAAEDAKEWILKMQQSLSRVETENRDALLTSFYRTVGREALKTLMRAKLARRTALRP